MADQLKQAFSHRAFRCVQISLGDKWLGAVSVVAFLAGACALQLEPPLLAPAVVFVFVVYCGIYISRLIFLMRKSRNPEDTTA